MRATLIAMVMTVLSIFNIPVFWPILVVYFIALFGLTAKRQITDMWQRGYVPWSYGKKRYAGLDTK